MADLFTDAVACFRLTRLITTDRVTRKLRAKVEDRYGTRGLGYLIGCDWCSSAYVAAGVVLARRYAPKVWGPVAEGLAFSAITGLLAERG